ncbi:MAG: 2-hydroxyacyl-CoA dehydratase family protein [Desulfobacterales bacterium]|nr:2-hydroxyacyl-CoA dehydratase family protein [Desulfobacterales bacterium]
MDIKFFYQDAVDDPYAYAARWKDRQRKPVVAHFCSYTPEEVIWAAGALPVRIFGQSARILAADTHLQSYACSLVRGAMEDALAGRLDFADGFVFPHTCDSIQRLSDIWRLNVPHGFHLDAVLPVKLNTPSARDYMRDIVKRFAHDLESRLGVEIADEALSDAIKLYNRLRQGLRAIHRLRSEHPEKLPGRVVHALSRAAMVMDREAFVDGLEQLMVDLEGHTPPFSDRKRLILSGGLCSMPDIYGLIETAGGDVVWDDLCTGSRYFDGEIDDEPSLLAGIADRYRERMVCPAKHMDLTRRGDHLVRLAKEHRAGGVIFVLLKFCDPHAFDYPYMKKMLDAAGIPSLLFEIEDQQVSAGQVRTRCEAFIEML